MNPSIVDLMPLLLGPGGVLVLMLIVGNKAYSFFSEQLLAERTKLERQEARLVELHQSTLRTIKEDRDILAKHTTAIEKLILTISGCHEKR